MLELAHQLVTDTSALATTELRRLEQRAVRAGHSTSRAIVLGILGTFMCALGALCLTGGAAWALVRLGLPPWTTLVALGGVWLLLGLAVLAYARPRRPL